MLNYAQAVWTPMVNKKELVKLDNLYCQTVRRIMDIAPCSNSGSVYCAAGIEDPAEQRMAAVISSYLAVRVTRTQTTATKYVKSRQHENDVKEQDVQEGQTRTLSRQPGKESVLRIQESGRYVAKRSRGPLAMLKSYVNDNHVEDHMLKALKSKQSRSVNYSPALVEKRFSKKCGSSNTRKTNPKQVQQCKEEWAEYSARVERDYVRGILACFSDGACVGATTGAGWFVTNSIHADSKDCVWEKRESVAIGHNSEICQAELVGAYETLKTVLRLLEKYPHLRSLDRAILHIDNELVFRIMVGEMWSDAHGQLANKAYKLIAEIRKLDVGGKG